MDLIPVNGERTPMVGGGPANTAKAVARLGYTAQFIGGISSDEFGSAIEKELQRSGVDLSLVLRGDLPTIERDGTFVDHTFSPLPTSDAQLVNENSRVRFRFSIRF